MRSKSITTLRASVLLLAMGLQGAMAAETGKSLYEQRQGIYQGTSKGILLFGSGDSGPAAQPKDAKIAPAPVKATSITSQPPPVKQATEAAVPARSPVFATPVFSQLPAPSGIPLNAVRHREGPERGVALPVARAASETKP